MVQLKQTLPTLLANGMLHQWIAAIISTYRALKTRESMNLRILVFSATLGIFSLGGVLGWTSPAFPSMIEENNGHFQNITKDHKSWIGSIATLGALCGCPISGLGVDKLGRKRTMLIAAIPFSVSWLMIAFSSGIPLMLVGRFISGFCGGIFSLAVPVYISEIAEDRIRGTLASMFQLMLVSGILGMYIIGTFVSWKILAIIFSIIPALFVLLMIPIPESPRCLLSHEKEIAAAKSLQWFRNGGDSSGELAQVRQSIEDSKTQNISGKDILNPVIMKPLLVSLYLMVFEQISGFNAVIFYTNDIFVASGSNVDSYLATIIVGIIQVLATIVSTVLVDKAGRRILLLFSEIVMAVALFAFSGFFYVQKYSSATIYISWLPILSLCVFVIAFAIGIGPLSWTIMSEILPPNAKGLCSAIATSVVWLSAFVVTKCYGNMLEIIGIENTFLIYAFCCIVGTVVIYFSVPETKGKDLDEIQLFFVPAGRSD